MSKSKSLTVTGTTKTGKLLDMDPQSIIEAMAHANSDGLRNLQKLIASYEEEVQSCNEEITRLTRYAKSRGLANRKDVELLVRRELEDFYDRKSRSNGSRVTLDSRDVKNIVDKASRFQESDLDRILTEEPENTRFTEREKETMQNLFRDGNVSITVIASNFKTNYKTVESIVSPRVTHSRPPTRPRPLNRRRK